MKFIKTLKIISSLLVITVVDCSDIETTKNSLDSSSRELNRKDELIGIALSGNWKTTDDEIEKALLQAFSSDSRSLNTAVPKISKINSTEIPVEKSYSKDRSAKIEECNNFEFDLYSLESEGYTGYAITSNDKRIGNVISIVDSEFQEDISNDDFSIMYAEMLESYIKSTSDLWNSISDKDINDYKARAAYKDIVTSGDYTYSAWKRNFGNNLYELKTDWDQDPDPFNSCIVSLVGNGAYYVGCGAVQVAQILAFHKYPNSFSSPNLSKIKQKWAISSNWNGKYDWNLLTSVRKPSRNSSAELRTQIGALMYDVAQGCQSTYSQTGTNSNTDVRLNYLKSLGYTYKGTSGYSLENIKNSINAGCPVLMRGDSKKTVTTKTTTYKFLFWKWKRTSSSTSYSGGHAFIIDGYYNMSCTASNGKNSYTLKADFVHCNPGWGGFQNGYYLSGVLDMNTGALVDDDGIDRASTTYGESYNYQYRLSQVNMLKPKGR